MERGSEERNQLNNYNLQISFSSSSSAAAAAPNNIHHELGFIHFADHNNLTFLPPSQSSHSLQAAAAAAAASVSVTPSAAINTNAAAVGGGAAAGGGLGFSHSELLVNRPSWNNNEQEALKALWKVAFPEEQLRGLISEQWKEMGWQGKDPSTDFRGGGFISLENLLYFARNFPRSFQDLLRKQEGDRAIWEYPFAVAGVNITFMLIQMLDLEALKPRNLVGATFLKFLAENESAFDLLYCITFKLMDNQWLAMRASYMDFNAVMKATRRQLEEELLQEDITRLEDLPSYNLLSR